MKPSLFSLLALAAAFACLAPLSARADELADLILTIQRGAEALSTAPAGSQALHHLSELQAAASRGEVNRAQAAAHRAAAEASIPAEVRAAAERLHQELPRLLEARAQLFIAEVDAAVERTRQECLAARREAELTPLLKDLSALQLRQIPAERSAVLARAGRKLDSAIKVTGAWMDYLAATQLGNRPRAQDALLSLAKDPTAYPIVPVSDYQQRLASSVSEPETVAKFSALLASIKTLRDAEAVAPRIRAFHVPVASPQVHAIASIQQWFTGFHSAAAALLSGDLEQAWKTADTAVQVQQGVWHPETLRLRGLLMTALIPAYLKTPPGAERRPDETAQDHLRRLIADAAAQGRWEEVHRIASTSMWARNTPVSGPNWLSILTSSLTSFFHARRLDEAGDYAGAIIGYESVLRTAVDFAPIREVTERLKALRVSQPEAFAEAHPRLESDRVFALIGNLGKTLTDVTERLAKFEEECQAQRAAGARPPPAQPPGITPATKADLEGVRAKLRELEAAAVSPQEALARLEKLELLFGPAAEVLARGSGDGQKFRIWLGSDFTIYRSALPPKLESRIGWVVRRNGKVALSRDAQNEFAYRYPQLRPGNYTVFLTLGGDNAPASNLLEFTISEEQAAKLLPRRAGSGDSAETNDP